jgi:hypothetical protein
VRLPLFLRVIVFLPHREKEKRERKEVLGLATTVVVRGAVLAWIFS